MKGLKIAAGVLLVGIGALAALPASWMGAPLESATEGRWRLSGAEGSVWNGSAQPVYVGEKGEALMMSRVAWDWQPKALLSGRLNWALQSSGQGGLLSLGLGEQTLSGLAFSLPAAALANLSKTWQAARLGGELQLQLAQLTRKGGQWGGQGQLAWQGASSPLTTIQPFGSYQLMASGNGQGVVFNVATLSGPLELSGQGQWQPGGALQLAGNAQSEPKEYEALKPLLLMLGHSSGPNAVSWQLK